MTFTPPNSHGNGLPLGLTGAVSPTRYVGGNASGAPLTGTFKVGDFTVNADGSIYICTVAGTPGTWTAVSGGGGAVEIGYDAITADVTVSSTVEATGTTVISCAAHTFDGGAVWAKFSCPAVVLNTAANSSVVPSLFEGAVQIQRFGVAYFNAGTAIAWPFERTIRFTPAAGSHTYTVTAHRVGADGTIQAGPGTTGLNGPAYVEFLKVT